MAFAYPGGQNTFVPTTELSGNLLVKFGRNIKDFPVNKLLRLRKTTKTAGLYTYFNPLDYARFSGPTANGQSNQFDWPAGTPAPTGFMNTIGFEFRSFQCRRKGYAGDLDLQGERQAEYPVLQATTEALAQLAMTDRALEASYEMTLSTNYPSTHVADAATLGGGGLHEGSPDDPILKRALTTLALRILKDSGGNVQARNLTIVMNPNTAQAISLSKEVQGVMRYGPYALPALTGKDEGSWKTNNDIFGIPDVIYGFKVVVEDTTYNPYNRDYASEARAFVFPDDVVAMVSREQDFEADENANSYSTFHLFVYGEDDMKVESETDTWNRILKMRVVDNRQVKVVAGVTGGLITNAVSTGGS